MSVSIVAIVIAVLGLGLVVAVLANAVRLLLSDSAGTVIKVAIAVLLVTVVSLTASLALRIGRTPPTRAINDVVEVTDASGELTITAIRMPAPTYDSGEGAIEKRHTATVTVEVANDSTQAIFLGLEYYTDAGLIGIYSPGAGSGAEIASVAAGWAGELQYPLRHHRFVAGGCIRMRLAKCKNAKTNGLSLPRDAELLFEKTYDVVCEPGFSDEPSQGDQ